MVDILRLIKIFAISFSLEIIDVFLFSKKNYFILFKEIDKTSKKILMLFNRRKK